MNEMWYNHNGELPCVIFQACLLAVAKATHSVSCSLNFRIYKCIDWTYLHSVRLYKKSRNTHYTRYGGILLDYASV